MPVQTLMNDLSDDEPAAPFVQPLIELLRAKGYATKAEVERALLPKEKKRWSDEVFAAKKLNPEKTQAVLDWPRWTADERLTLLAGLRRSEIGLGPIEPPEPLDWAVLDAVCIGALNIDHILGAAVLAATFPEGLPPALIFEPGREVVAVSGTDIEAELNPIPTASITHRQGGSSFNVVRLLAGAGCRCGFVGVSGLPPAASVAAGLVPHAALLEGLCDTRFVRTTDEPAGRCCSIAVPDENQIPERRMRVWPGANTQIRALLLEEFWPLVDYLSHARVIHVTSLLDDFSPEILADLLELVAARSPLTIISLDPGYTWSKAPSPAVSRILRCANLLFVNDREFQLLASHVGSSDIGPPLDKTAADEARADTLKGQLRSGASVIVVKQVGTTVVYTDNGAETITMPDGLAAVIDDDTGAGDVFAAGFLAARLSGVPSAQFGGRLGMALAREKVGQLGMPELDALARCASTLLGQGTVA